MLTNDATILKIKHEVLYQVAKLAYAGEFDEKKDELAYKLIPGPKPQFRCCVYKEREIVRQRVRLAEGLCPTESDHSGSKNVIQVIESACADCPLSHYIVTDNCRKCMAKACQQSCKFGAISMGRDRAYIDPDKCKECGMCAKNCPYNAIADLIRPCKKVCPVNAITMDENGICVIDEEKCIRCGQCIHRCPFGAIGSKTDIVAIIKDMLKPSIDFLASIDLRTGQFFHEKGRIEWLIKNDNKRNGLGYEFEQFGIYRVTVRKCIPKKLQPYQVQYINNRYMLINVLEEHASNEKLEALKEYYAKPISMENELGSFDLDREFSWFEGIVNWNGVEANVYLETDEEDGDTAEQAMKVLKELVDNIVDNDNKYRAFAAQELTELANEWLEDSDEIDTEKITRELFKKRMEISSITVSPDGSLSLFYNDDDMFWGHIIEIVVEPNGEIISANIAG